jgi:hypothetical protein
MASGKCGDRIADTIAVGARRSLARKTIAHRDPPQAGTSLTVDVAG